MEKNDKRQKIMAAVEKLFTSRRFHEITLDQVAHTAGVGKGTIYRHFQDKDELFFQTAISGFDDLCAVLTKNISGDASFNGQLLNACIQISRFFERRRQLFRMIQMEQDLIYRQKPGIRDRWVLKRNKLIEALAGIIGKGLVEGKVRPDIPPETLAYFLLSILSTRSNEIGDTRQIMPRFDLVINFFCWGACRDGEKIENPQLGFAHK